MKGLWRACLFGAGAAVAGITATGVAAYSSTRYLLKVALDREMPTVPRLEQAKAKLCGSEKMGQFLDHMAAAAEKLESTPHTTVTIQSYDGQSLVGHWYDTPDPKRVIIAMHGWRSGWSSDFGTIANFWHKNGCCVLYAEQRGQGNSGGSHMGFGMMERYDCLYWCKWVNSHCRHLPVYLAGVSMGATTVLLTADLELPANVRGIMADCGFTSAHDIWKHVAEKNLHMNYQVRRAMADALCRGKIAMSPKDCSTIQALSKCKIPVLFAHGTQDHFVPVEMTYANYAACASEKYLLIVPGAEHGMCYFMETERYRKAVLDFWESCEKEALA